MLTQSNLLNAIDRGVIYLDQTQKVNGEFATYTSPHLDMIGASVYPKSVYLTTFVIHSLCYLPNHSLIAPIQKRAAEFLIGEREEFGGWNYEGRGQWRVPADFDDTSCAVAALLKLGYQPDFSFYTLLWQNEENATGPYYTWIGINNLPNELMAKQIDALVNANILFCAGLLNLSLPKTAQYLKQVVNSERYEADNLYCLSPHFFIYTLSRAYADGQVNELFSIIPSLREYILNKWPSPEVEQSAFNLACITASLLNLHADLSQIKPYLSQLISKQQSDGSWPIWAAYAGFRPNYDGGPALTTALALESIGKWAKRVGSFL